VLTLTADFLLSKMVICSIIYKLTLEFFTNPNLAKLPILKLQNLLVGTIGIAIQVIKTTSCRDYNLHMLKVRHIKANLQSWFIF